VLNSGIDIQERTAAFPGLKIREQRRTFAGFVSVESAFVGGQLFQIAGIFQVSAFAWPLAAFEVRN
jgi:hypothetical protein